MEDRDLKAAVQMIKKKRKKELMERLIIFLSGLLITLVFIALGLNYYSKSEKTISEPDIKVATNLEKPATPPQQIEAQPQPTQPPQQPTAESQPSQPKQEEQPAGQPNVKPEEAKKPVQEKEPAKEQLAKEQPKEEKSKQPATATKVEKNKEESKPVKHKESKENKKVDSTEITSLISSGGFSIQVGAFSTREKAEIEKAKYPNAYIIEENGLHKVLVGKFKTEKEARDYQRAHDIKGFIKRVGS
ncbi:SPOR domain-containing protein [Sulfurihydrogenibium sp.]|jgi:outer membrane biosynthesis protein TonB|uniref:SPOR domain-containing protein n=1 Tax=Sulfurihydrogenibium sp. TaxID=2053621 RepID=UPI002605ADDE|nr:SPOR domain-containing protein [Sulfurihydrogenibium sp.]